jgi:hypothetical protein
MFFTSMSVLAATWLFFTPFLWPELPARGVLAAAAGLAALFVAVMSIAAPRARLGLVAIGAILAAANFVLPGGKDALANLCVASLMLFAGGMAPSPRVSVSAAVPALQPRRERLEAPAPRLAA